MKRSITLCIACITMLLTGCKSDPTDIAKQIVAQHITTESNGALKLKDFTKVNAQSAQMFGVDLYEVEYRATAEAITSGGWVYVYTGIANALVSCEVKDPTQKGMENHQLKSGEVFDLMPNGRTRHVTLKKTENGWVENEH